MPSFLHSPQPHLGQVTMTTPPLLEIRQLEGYHSYTKLTIPKNSLPLCQDVYPKNPSNISSKGNFSFFSVN